MKTLKELFVAHGSVWLADKSDHNKKLFKPMGYSEDGLFLIGEGAGDHGTRYPSSAKYDSTEFVLYKAPTKKKIYYKYVFKYEDGKPNVSSYLFENDGEFKLCHDSPDLLWFKQLEPGIEIEE